MTNRSGRAGIDGDQNDRRTSPSDHNEPSAIDVQRVLTDQQFSRWAVLVADGAEPLPSDLRPVQQEQLAVRVRELRRARLRSFIARQVALDMYRNANAAPTAPLHVAGEP